MTRTDFIHQTVIALASNSSVIKDNYTVADCARLITELSESIADKVHEKAAFDVEYEI